MQQPHSKGFWILGVLVFGFSLLLWTVVRATTNIDSVNRYAWNDTIGWIDFFGTNTVNVLSSGLQGYASSSAGDVSLDCHTTRNNNICASSTYQVANDGLGDLSSYAWNDTYGWISFCGGQSTSTCPGTVVYQVQINSTNGNFSGYGWNDTVGWISFCGNSGGTGGCASTSFPYLVDTSWSATSTSGSLDSSIYDTGVSGGAQMNSVLWHGNLPSNTQVRFKFATSNATSGPWNYLGPAGTTADTDYFGPVLPDQSYKLDYILFNNQRYFRYRIILVSDQAQSLTPRVDQVLVNWSP